MVLQLCHVGYDTFPRNPVQVPLPWGKAIKSGIVCDNEGKKITNEVKKNS